MLKSESNKQAVSPAEQTLRRLAAERILVLDGAMGTMIQELKLDEGGYRGARFDAWNREVRGNNDLLILTQPQAIRDIHLAYYRAGADIVSTNTFSYDTTAPTATITYPVALQYINAAPTISGTSIDNYTNVDLVQVSVKRNGSPDACSTVEP